MDGRAERSETTRLRWELLVSRLGSELDKIVDEAGDEETRVEAANTVFTLYCSVVVRAQELEDFAEDWVARNPYLSERLDRIRLQYPLPVPSWGEEVADPQ